MDMSGIETLADDTTAVWVGKETENATKML